MKQISLLQQNTTRRSNSFRGSIDGSGDGAIKSPSSLFWVLLHGSCCLISLVLGFRFSRLVFFLLFSNPNTTTTTTTKTQLTQSPAMFRQVFPASYRMESKVVVGRHGIRIRPWPHPNPVEVTKAHKLLERVQKEQRVQYGVKHLRGLIVVTPTYVRTFQTPHFIGLIHSLMNVPYDVTWIVVESGGVTNETASLIHKSGAMSIIHVGFGQKMPITTWSGRIRVENLLRIEALRLVRERKLDGIVVFADDSNMHSMEFFDEVQKVEWFGALSFGILMHSGGNEPLQVDKVENDEGNLPVQGPVCNSSENLVGWRTFNTMPYVGRSAVYIGDMGTVLPRKMEWAGFVLNSRLLWKDGVDKPDLIKDLDSFEEGDIESPLSLLKNPLMVEPLGSCGRKVLLWWLRVEARADSKFPSGWVMKTPLEITVPAKHTPLSDVPPKVSSDLKVATTEPQFVEERPEKRSPKARSRKRSSRKRKPDTRVT